MLYRQRPVPFPPEPTVLVTADTGARASQLMKNPGVQRLARGLWVLREEPLSGLERSVLLQKHIGGPDAGLAVGGVHALKLFRLPVGGTEAWVQPVLTGGKSGSGRNRNGGRADELAAARQRTELLWTHHRVQSQQRGIRIAKSQGLPCLEGPWGGCIAHPVEVLARLSKLLAPWRITACLDAMISTQFVLPGSTTPVSFTRDHVEQCLDQLPPTSHGTARMRRAWRDARSPCWSAPETLTRLLIDRAGLPEPQLNVQVTVAGRTFILDLAWPEARIALEYNGAVHAREIDQYRDEMYRLGLLRDAGWDVSVLTWDDLRSPARREAWLTRVRRALR